MESDSVLEAAFCGRSMNSNPNSSSTGTRPLEIEGKGEVEVRCQACVVDKLCLSDEPDIKDIYISKKKRWWWWWGGIQHFPGGPRWLHD